MFITGEGSLLADVKLLVLYYIDLSSVTTKYLQF